jgi:hypothetical protein
VCSDEQVGWSHHDTGYCRVATDTQHFDRMEAAGVFGDLGTPLRLFQPSILGVILF